MSVIVVSGAASGIGAAVRRSAVNAGHRVLALDLSAPQGDDLDPDTHWERCDVTDPNHIDLALDRGLAALGEPAIGLVHCAGVYLRSPSEALDLDIWRRVLDINASGSFHLASLVGRRMLENGRGSIVLLSSTAHALGDAVEPSAAYAASKGAVASLGRQLAVEWGGRGIRTNVVVPGVIDTPMTTIVQHEDGFRQVVSTIPLGRLGTADEVAQVCLFLTSDAASFVNGAIVPVDGGQLVS